MRSKFACSLLIIIAVSCSPNNVKNDSRLKKYFDENKVES